MSRGLRPHPRWCPYLRRRGEAWRELGGGGGSLEDLLGRAGHAGSVAGCSLPQLAQWGGDAQQQPARGRRMPSFGQVELAQRCSVFLWWRAQIGPVE